MSLDVKVAVVVLAAGSGTRFGNEINKVWLKLNGKHIISRTLENAASGFKNPRILLVINPDDQDFAREALLADVMDPNIEIIHGGSTRHESELKALEYLKVDIEVGAIDIVLIHDGARPLATPKLFVEVAQGAITHGGAIPTIALDSHEMDMRRDEVIARVQTPQGFRAKPLLQAYEQSAMDSFVGTDTAACMERYFPELKTVAIPGDILNIKITYAKDLEIAQLLLPAQ